MTAGGNKPDGATISESERGALIKTFGVTLDISDLNQVQLAFLATNRRIREIEAEALGRLCKAPNA